MRAAQKAAFFFSFGLSPAMPRHRNVPAPGNRQASDRVFPGAGQVPAMTAYDVT